MNKTLIGIIILAIVTAAYTLLRPESSNSDSVFAGFVGGFITDAWILPGPLLENG